MKRVLNTMIKRSTSENIRSKYIYWGASLLKNVLTSEAVLALDGCNIGTGRELRSDRFKIFNDYDVNQSVPLGEGKYVVMCFPVEFGGDGRFRTDTFVYNFEHLTVIEDFTDHEGRSYPMNVFISYTKFHGVITGELKAM